MADEGFLQRVASIEALTEALDGRADPATRASARELVQAILELHAAGLARIVEILGAAGEPGRVLLDRVAEDDLVGSLLLLHGLHPVDAETRVRRALHRRELDLNAQGIRVELLGVERQVVRLAVAGPWEAVRETLEAAIVEAAPDVTAIEIEERTFPGPRRVPLPIISTGARP